MSTITTNESNPAALKLLVAGNLAKKKIQVKIVNPADKDLELPRHLPYLETGADSVIFIPNAAVWYLLPPNEKSETAASKIGEWCDWEATVLAPSLTQLLGGSSKNDKTKNCVASSLKKLNNALSTGNLIEVGSDLTACHVSIWSLLYPLYKESALCKEYLEENPNVINWMKTLEEKPEFKDAVSKLKMAPGVQSYQSLLTGAKYLSGVPTAASPSNESLNLSPQHQPEVITREELEAAEKAWGNTKVPKLNRLSNPVLPKQNQKNILITSALPYVNNVPHLGNIIGCVLSSDVFARFCRICNRNTLFIGGTDEYGTATETKALEENMSCRAICDKYFAIHDDIYKWFNISFDYFGRTSAPEQTELCQAMFLTLNDNGFMFTERVEQLHCEKCDRFLADRFVEGGCPHPGCTYEDARGDQCDGCGKLVNATDLRDPRCKVCSATPKLKTSSQFFLDLPKLEPLLLHWMKLSAPGWSNNAQVIGKAWLREGLKPRCITRDLKWGVPVPLKDFSSKVFYVWFDAPIGYMSISKAYTKEWEKWWRPQADTEVTLYQFMAKDNVPFHSVMFPATLLGANRGYVTVSHIMATEYLNYEDGKFSKSRGVGVFGNDARDTGIPSDVWRFYLLYLRPESQDSSFSWADLATKNNSELLNNLGNFINRALMFAKNNFDRTVPEMRLLKEDYQLLVLCTRELRSYIACLEKSKLRDGIRHILSISRHGNQYMQSNQPWVLLKGSAEDKIRAGTVIAVSCNIACLLGILLHPYLPETSDKLKKQLNAPDIALIPENPVIGQLLPSGHKLGEPSPLFAKLEPATVEELKKKFTGKQGENGGQSKVGTTSLGGSLDVKTLESELAKQADKVRALKSSGVDKKLWQPEVTILLHLKKKLEEAQKLPVINNCQNGGDVSNVDLKSIEDLIAQQGTLVRKLKEGGAEKSQWQPEVAKLLELKNKLASLTGAPVGGANQKGKKSKK